MDKTQTIKTRYITSPNSGKAQVIAKSRGKQRTIAYDHSESVNTNHGRAAGELARVFGWLEADALTHLITDDGTHVFTRL